jgi:hypothetical protein
MQKLINKIKENVLMSACIVIIISQAISIAATIFHNIINR